MIEPWKLMTDRLEAARAEGLGELFNDLLNAGELLAKLSVAIPLACLQEDSARTAHGCSWQLVRADSLGKWSDAGRDMWKPPCRSLFAEETLRALASMHTTTRDDSEWHRRALLRLDEALRLLKPDCDAVPGKSSYSHWLQKFSELRNSTRGHGAQPLEPRKKAADLLFYAVTIVAEECPALQLPLFHITHDLSGKVHVIPLTTTETEAPRDIEWGAIQNGRVAVLADGLHEVPLLFATSDRSDFLLPNGAYKEKGDTSSFEVISYITGDISRRDGSDYRGDPGGLPFSTTAAGELDARGKLFTNAPMPIANYVRREELETELSAVVGNRERYPVVTLLGRGGIGKTSLALAEIKRLEDSEQYFAVVWFSARDIDLLDEGPKPVRADVLTLEEVARSYKRVVGDSSKRPAKEVFAEALGRSDLGPVLFVFDNFETIRQPEEFFRFVDDRVRLPNKILITTRHRSFKADFPIEVKGMTDAQCTLLVRDQAQRLQISQSLSPELEQEIIRESEGHPYVIKIMLGEIARDPTAKKVSRVIASRDEILDALFDRTYSSLSTGARRVFLTLCGWRSVIPMIALEAVLLREANERIRVDEAIEELERLSFIETHQAEADNALFVGVPLAAALFGQRKLRVSEERAAVDADVSILRDFGAGQSADVDRGLAPRMQRMFQSLARDINAGRKTLAENEGMLQFLARGWPEAWLYIAQLRRETADDIEGEKAALRSYLETAGGAGALDAWKELGIACKRSGDMIGEIQAWAEMSALPNIPLNEVSRAVNRVNGIFAENKDAAPTDERRILLRRFVDVMAHRLDDADANDLSRLAWLYLQLGDESRAHEVASLGLRRDPKNYHCQRLLDRMMERSALRGPN
jgi:NB-ARC domain